VPTFASITRNDGRGGSHVVAWFAAAVPAPDAAPERARTPSCAYLYQLGPRSRTHPDTLAGDKGPR
jgi:hypothetical protein